MKDLAKTIGGILFWIFVVLVFFWTASLSLGELRIILPNDPIQPYIGLILTDVGALVWLLVFIGRAKGLVQRSIAILMLVVDLAGVILLAGGRLLTAGQTLTEIPEQLGSTLVWGLIGLTLLNLIAAYVFHLADPATAQEIEIGVLTDKLEKEALNQARRNLEGEAQRLGAVLAARATARLKYELRLPMNDQENARLLEDRQMDLMPAKKQVIDAQAKEPDKAPSLFEKIFKKAPSPVSAMVTNEQTVTQQAKLQPDKDQALRAKLEDELKNGIITRDTYNLLKTQIDMDAQENESQTHSQSDKPWVRIVDAMGILDRKKPTQQEKPPEEPPAGDAPFPGSD